MNNSEIIKAIISQNAPQKTSEIRKVQILQLAARFGTADDIREVYKTYREFEFQSGALSYACQYADQDKIEVLLKNGAHFYSEKLSYDLKTKYIDDPWNYRMSILPGFKCKRIADNLDLVSKVSKEMPVEPTIMEASISKRVDIFQEILKTIHEYARTTICSGMLIRALALGYSDFVTECFKRGMTIGRSAIVEVNSTDFSLLKSLSKLDIEQRYTAFSMFCDAAENVGLQIVPDGTLSQFKDVLCIPQIMELFLDRCDLKRYSKKKIIEIIIQCESTELLSMLEYRHYFDNANLRNAATAYANQHDFDVSYKWLLESSDRIRSTAILEVRNHTANDSWNAKWFKHKGNMITGISKAGIKTINENRIKEITFPTIMDGVEIEMINADTVVSIEDSVPTINTIIIPEGLYIKGFVYYGFSKETPVSSSETKTLVFESDSSFSKETIPFTTTDIVINNGNKYKTIEGVVFSADGKTLEYYPRGKRISTYIVPLGVKEIAREAFLRCTIDRLVISDSVEELGRRLAWDSHIKSVDIGAGIKEIPEEAFDGCSDMEELILHEGLIAIRWQAFRYCGATHITFPKTLKYIDKDAFSQSTSHFTFLSDDVLIGPHAFFGCPREGTNYSPKIEGKMQRCGYSQYDYYDVYCDLTRDEAIRQLNSLTGYSIDISEEMRLDEILEMLKELKKN